MERDRLYLLAPDFADPAYPGRRFYCWHCALLEGVLASYPALAERIDVVRVAWPRPRAALIDLIGEANQSLPVLILADGAPADLATSTYEGRRFIDDKDAILHPLAVRHGIAEPHP